jgi:hypothetical protein
MYITFALDCYIAVTGDLVPRYFSAIPVGFPIFWHHPGAAKNDIHTVPVRAAWLAPRDEPIGRFETRQRAFSHCLIAQRDLAETKRRAVIYALSEVQAC